MYVHAFLYIVVEVNDEKRNLLDGYCGLQNSVCVYVWRMLLHGKNTINSRTWRVMVRRESLGWRLQEWWWYRWWNDGMVVVIDIIIRLAVRTVVEYLEDRLHSYSRYCYSYYYSITNDSSRRCFVSHTGVDDLDHCCMVAVGMIRIWIISASRSCLSCAKSLAVQS